MSIIYIIHPIDRSLKVLARQYPQELVKFIDIPPVNVITIDNPNLNIPEKQADFIPIKG